MFGAVAAGSACGGYDTIGDAAHAMARVKSESYKPNLDAASAYKELYQAYLELHDYFGRGVSL